MSTRPPMADAENHHHQQVVRLKAKPENRRALQEISNRQSEPPASDDTIEDEGVADDDFMHDDQLDHDHSHVLEDEPLPSALCSGQLGASTTNPDVLFPVTTAESTRLLEKCAHIAYETPGILDEHDEDVYDIAMAVEYSDEIFAYMRRLELKMLPDHSYMDRQQEIKWSMRSILVDWLVQVHQRFNLLPETLFLTINYIDRFLSHKQIQLNKFQLFGIVGLFLAAKYEEVNCPSVQELVYMVDSGYTAEDILAAERYMIDVLDFNLGYPGPMSFLRRTSKADDYDLETRTLAKYLLEITIIDQRFVSAPASWTAAIAHYLARHMLDKGQWTALHTYFSGYTEQQLAPGVYALKECCRDPQTHHRAIYEKYSERRFKRAAEYVRSWMAQK